MEKHSIFIATPCESKFKVIENFCSKNITHYYNCKIKNTAEYQQIFDIWDDLDALTLKEQSNTLVIFDPNIYDNIPIMVTGENNYWHETQIVELYPWYELILRYPLVTPIFLTKGKKLFNGYEVDNFCFIDLNQDIKKQFEDNVKLFLNGIKTWFDPFGLRDCWRDKVLGKIFHQSDKKIITETLPKVVYCVEDELNYGLLNAYVAYKFGANVHLIESFSSLKWAEQKEKGKNDTVVIRDKDLRFRDFKTEGGRTRESLKTEDGIFALSGKVDTLMISIDTTPDEKNIKKPLNLIYDIKEKCSLLKENDKLKRTRIKDYSDETLNKASNHSSPYINIQLSRHLVDSALSTKNSHHNMIFSALHYMEAYAVLGKITETTLTQILKDLHLSELDFALSFMGVDKNQTTAERKKDVEDDINHLLGTDNKDLKYSFLISFWNDAKVIYKKYEQFNAAEESNLEVMSLEKWSPHWMNLKAIHLEKISQITPKRLILEIFTNLKIGFLAFLVINLSLSFIYRMLNICSYPDYFMCLIHTFIATITLNTPIFLPSNNLWVSDTWLVILVLVHMLFAYIFLGILISIIYRKLTRT